MKFGRLSEIMACEVTDFDVRALSDPETIEEIRHAIYEYQILVFRKQTLTADELLAFTGKLGEIDGSHVQSEFSLAGPSGYLRHFEYAA